MSYLLIGNISALISDNCIEPLSRARLRVYLPDHRYLSFYSPKNLWGAPRQLAEAEVHDKQERLLAEALLDAQGNFSLCWEQLHLFTEPLELDLYFDEAAGCASPAGRGRQYHLASLVLPWKRCRERYVAAYTCAVPQDCWSRNRTGFNTRIRPQVANKPAGSLRWFNNRPAISRRSSLVDY